MVVRFNTCDEDCDVIGDGIGMGTWCFSNAVYCVALGVTFLGTASEDLLTTKDYLLFRPDATSSLDNGW